MRAASCQPAAAARGLSLVEPPKKSRAAWVVRLRCGATVDGPIVSTEEVLNALDTVKLPRRASPARLSSSEACGDKREGVVAPRPGTRSQRVQEGREDRWASAIRLCGCAARIYRYAGRGTAASGARG